MAAKGSEQELHALVEASRVTGAEVNEFRGCIRGLQGMMASVGPTWIVRPFGSSANGFGTKGSDLDVTCVRIDVGDQYRAQAIHELQAHFAPLLMQDPSFELVEAVWTARVPILRLKFEGRLEVDLSCQNTEAILNTELLKAYAKLHPCVRQLVVLVKLWAKAQGLCGAPQGHLSSYSLTLMVIYFLQVQHDLQLPRLPTEDFNVATGSPDFSHLNWMCPMNISDLLSHFFHFYCYEFQWGAEVVSVRAGYRAQMGSPEFRQLSCQGVWRLHIEDPFLLGRNLNCVLGSIQELQLRDRLNAAALDAAAGRVPEGLQELLTQSQLPNLFSSMSLASTKSQLEDGSQSMSEEETSNATPSSKALNLLMGGTDQRIAQWSQFSAEMPVAPSPEKVPLPRLWSVTVRL